MHTPGPWKLNRTYGTLVESESGRTIAAANCCQACGYDPEISAENQANARLIAAAPEMLFALRYVLLFVERKEKEEGGCAGYVREIRAAIAKATGKEDHAG